MAVTTLIAEETWGRLPSGEAVKAYTLKNDAGTQARFTNLGASFIGLTLGNDTDSTNLVLSGDTLEAQANQPAYLGATVGRFANRIGFGRTQVNDEPIQLDVNSEPHHLHGGQQGFGYRLWESHIELVDDEPTLIFRLHSADGEGGYPGELQVEQRIRLTADNRVWIDYQAETTKPTPINLTNHAYFNLEGAGSGTLKGHEFRIHSEELTEADATALPTGNILAVNNSVFDLREWSQVTDHLHTLVDPALKRAGGYDHNYIFGTVNKAAPTLQAEARHSESGRWMKCHSTLPGMQFYTGNFLGGTPKNDKERFERHGAFCMEPGFWPDSPNHEHFPDCILRPGQTFRASIVYQFGRD